MNLSTIFQRFPDQEACIEHLERVRWRDYPYCPRCGSDKVARKAEAYRVGRWNCHKCHASFNVLSGTIFEKTKLPLQKWFMAIGIMVNAKNKVSSHQLARDLDLNQKSAWFMQRRIQAAMIEDQSPMLRGIVETNETDTTAKHRKENKSEDRKLVKGDQSTDETPNNKSVERGRNVIAHVTKNPSSTGIFCLLQEAVGTVGVLLIIEDYWVYAAATHGHNHYTSINHSIAYVDDDARTNLIKDFWALTRRAWYWWYLHHRYHRRLLFVEGVSRKGQHRKTESWLGGFLRRIFQ